MPRNIYRVYSLFILGTEGWVRWVFLCYIMPTVLLQSEGNFMRFVHCSFSSEDNTWSYANFPLQNRYQKVFPGA